MQRSLVIISNSYVRALDQILIGLRCGGLGKDLWLSRNLGTLIPEK